MSESINKLNKANQLEMRQEQALSGAHPQSVNLEHAIKNSPIPEASLQREVSWYPDVPPYIPEKSPNSALRIALIASDRLYRGLQHEGTVLILTEENWAYTLKYAKPDFVLVESCMETATGDWSMVQTAPDLPGSNFISLINSAKKLGIPTVYWFTRGYEYHELFAQVTTFFDYVFCADEREIPKLKSLDVTADALLPAVQPALYNAIQEYRGKTVKRIPGVCDGLADVILQWQDKRSLCVDMAEIGFKFFDSVNQIWKSKANTTELAAENLLGTLDFNARLAIFKAANIYCILGGGNTTQTERQWQAMEAAACRLPVIFHGKPVKGDVLETFSTCELNASRFLVELVRHQKDALYRERAAQRSWRMVVRDHSYSCRVQKICEHIGIHHGWVEYPSAALITPTYRPEFITRALKHYQYMDYPNKEWVIAFNGKFEDLDKAKKIIGNISGASMVYVPSELHAGPCMNLGIQNSRSDYVFRMDDDDYYGQHYLLDAMLYTRVGDFDVSGKIFKYFVLKDKYPDTVFSRNAKMFDFPRPAVCDIKKFPKFSILAGATQGGKKSFMSKYKYPNSDFGAVDSQWLDGLKEKKVGKALVFDDMNFVVDRRLTGDHTWAADMDIFTKNSTSEISNIEEVTNV